MGEDVIFVDTDRWGRVTALYNGKVLRFTRRRFVEFLKEAKPIAIVTDKPLDIPYPQIVLRHPQLLAQTRRRLGLEKSDENDVKVLKHLYETKPDAFKQYTITENFMDKYMAVVEAIRCVKRGGLECRKDVERLLLGEVEEKLNRILDREIYEHVKRKAKEKFGLNLNGVAFKLLISTPSNC